MQEISDCQRAAISWRTMNGQGSVDSSTSTSCCTFAGITCNGSAVTGISWSQKGLYGQIDANLAFLENLTLLDLSYNNLYGVWNTNSSGADPTNFDSLMHCNVVGTTVCENRLCSMECINEVPRVCNVGKCFNGMGSVNTALTTSTVTTSTAGASEATFIPDCFDTASWMQGNQNANTALSALPNLFLLAALYLFH
ncbi:hypothetical protein HDV01_002778 [Terramyces sp. JEL0728]|nr:hypothetical protein HDV01_002778 [Terramyces sp. JEL0728]